MELQEILALDFKETYRLFISALPEIESAGLAPEYEKVRFGFSVFFDVYSYLNDSFSVKEKQGLIWIDGKWTPLQEFHTELEERLAYMQRFLIAALTDVDIIEPRP